jgi:hypothetical protein
MSRQESGPKSYATLLSRQKLCGRPRGKGVHRGASEAISMPDGAHVQAWRVVAEVVRMSEENHRACLGTASPGMFNQALLAVLEFRTGL